MGWHEKSKRVDIAESALSNAIAKCEADKKLTLEANDALQRDKDAIARKLANSKWMLKAQCVPIARTPVTSDSRPEYAGSDGLSTEWLLDYAAQCELYRSSVIVAQKFLEDERK